MRAERDSTGTPIGLGFRAGRGGSVVVGVVTENREPRVMLSRFLATGTGDDRLALEPYHVAAEMERDPDGGVSAEAAATIAEGRRRQGKLAAKGLNDIHRELRETGCRPGVAALLINRAGWLTDDLAHCLAGVEHARVAEGLAVRDALRFALRQCRVDVVEMGEKSLHEAASKALGRAPGEIERRLQDLGATVGRPWRKEQKLACLSAWVAVAPSGDFLRNTI